MYCTLYVGTAFCVVQASLSILMKSFSYWHSVVKIEPRQLYDTVIEFLHTVCTLKVLYVVYCNSSATAQQGKHCPGKPKEGSLYQHTHLYRLTQIERHQLAD